MFEDLEYTNHLHISAYTLHVGNTLYRGSLRHKYHTLTVVVPYIAATRLYQDTDLNEIEHTETSYPTKKQLALYKLKNNVPKNKQQGVMFGNLPLILQPLSLEEKCSYLSKLDHDMIRYM